MGTRNLTAVKIDKEYRVAQFGQWDGYPTGQGATALKFLRKCDHNRFKDKVRKLYYLTQEEIDMVNDTPNWSSVYPELSRDTAAEILEMIYDSERDLELLDNLSFAGDSLFCEWGYIIDFDTNTFEVYEGFNKYPLDESDRFYGFGKEGSAYHPIKLVKSYPLDDLPTVEQMCKDCEPPDEDEDEE